MFKSYLLPLLEGIVAGVIVAVASFRIYSRAQRKAATGIMATARLEAEQLTAAASKKADEARTAQIGRAHV